MIKVDPGDVAEWYQVPFDDIAYYDSRTEWTDQELKDLVVRAEINRYQGWRNDGGLWFSRLLRMQRHHGITEGVPSLVDKQVLDWGCGLGIEAMQYDRAGAIVSLADLSQANVDLAARVLRLHGSLQLGFGWVIGRDDIARLAPDLFDVVHCAGVLHHIRDPRPTVELWRQLIMSTGEVRLMVYSDVGWRIAMRKAGMPEDPPEDEELGERRDQFTRFYDGVGHWADWYDETKLAELCEGLFSVREFTYITPDARYAVAVLDPR